MIKLSLVLIIFGVIAYALFRVTAAYRNSAGTTWQRLYTTTKNSATLFWSAFVGVVTMGMNGVMSLSDMLGAPEVRDFVTRNLSPEVASGIMLGVLVIVTVSRMRSLR